MTEEEQLALILDENDPCSGEPPADGSEHHDVVSSSGDGVVYFGFFVVGGIIGLVKYGFVGGVICALLGPLTVLFSIMSLFGW